MVHSDMPQHRDIYRRIDELCARADEGSLELGLLDEMNDVLCEGFACALAAEARLDRLEQRLMTLLSAVHAGRAEELRDITSQRRAVELHASRLRSRLAVLHRQYASLAGRMQAQTNR